MLSNFALLDIVKFWLGFMSNIQKKTYALAIKIKCSKVTLFFRLLFCPLRPQSKIGKDPT